ncbi:hypothetical protein M0D21_21705 [Aquimarina sp. D1M17]|uniref:hypothetical protein n=1 Tax=Aquimarina acroporae TaxID=2937283 RepID=UPI0020C055CC|nr:hypothetical protein [Aquimarina acroporae]MCK8524209.1 hypothetical protein [Aquimarina acroporae]
MKKNIIFILAALLVVSCNTSVKSKVGENLISDLSFNSCYNDVAESYEFDLDSLENFGSLIQNLDRITCENQKPVIGFNINNSRYRISPCHSCPDNRIIFCSKQRNELYIKKDSVRVDNFTAFPIDSLKQILRKHILNEKNESKYSESPKKAFVSISTNSNESINTIKNILLEIGEEFVEIKKDYKDSLYLSVQFKTNFAFDLSPPPSTK